MIEYLQLGSTIATISLSIALGTLTIISNQQNVYHLILQSVHLLFHYIQ